MSTVKNYFAIAFTCVYLTLTVGVAKTTHYCLGRLSSTSLFSFDADTCGCSLFRGAEKPACCHNESELVKVENDHAAASVLSVVDAAQAGFVAIPLFFDLPVDFRKHDYLMKWEKKPPRPVPLYTLYSSFRFFDAAAQA